MCEAHLWKPGESDKFKLGGWEYEIAMEADYRISLRVNGNPPRFFPDMNRLFAYIFKSRMMSYN